MMLFNLANSFKPSRMLVMGVFFIFLGVTSVAFGLIQRTEEIKDAVAISIPLDPQTMGRISAVQHVEKVNAMLIAEGIAYSFNHTKKSKAPIDPEKLRQYLLSKLEENSYTIEEDYLSTQNRPKLVPR